MVVRGNHVEPREDSVVLKCLGVFVDRHVGQKLQEPSVKLGVFGMGLGDQPAFVARYVGETSGGGRSRSCETGMR